MGARLAALCLMAALIAALDPDDWKFLAAYPKHYTVHKLATTDVIKIDGKLDDPAWADAAWAGDFVDITRHTQSSRNLVPAEFQTRVKLRWDSDYLYVGAELRERFVFANITGHNQVAPYHDNDFEFFVDPSGSSQFYKEFEMSALNATYDVFWGVPDQWGLDCSKNASSIVPLCVNTSFPGYSGTWTMAPGLQTATSTPVFGRFGNHTWSLEIAFPLRASRGHGGLLDGFRPGAYDPELGDAASGLPRFWWMDFARAEHPRAYQLQHQSQLCPFNCSNELQFAEAALSNPTARQCLEAQAAWPTLLGTDVYYGCYWEWVWQDLGDQAYMHRPQLWGMLQFVSPTSSRQQACKNIEFPGRYLAEQSFLAQRTFAAAHNNSFAASTAQLKAACVAPGCDSSAFAVLEEHPEVFEIGVNVTMDAHELTRECSSRPCFTVSVGVTVPGSSEYRYTVRVTNNHLVEVQHATNQGLQAPCLDDNLSMS